MHHHRSGELLDNTETDVPLFVVDLSSSRLLVPMVRRAVRQAIARAKAGSRIAPGRDPLVRLLIHGDSRGFRGLAGVELRTTLDYALPHVGSADEPWVNAASDELLYGSGARFFPEVQGISLADLCRLEVQDYFLNYAHLAGALCRALAERPTSFCKIFTIDAERGEALRATIADLVERVEWWTPPFIREFRQSGRTLRRRVGGLGRSNPHARRLAALQSVDGEALGKASVLFLSEAAPMAQMFSVVERHLQESDDGLPLRLQLCGARETLAMEQHEGVVVASFGHPSALKQGSAARFSRAWRTTARESRGVMIRKPYAGASGVATLCAPIRQLLERLYWERFDQLVEHIELARALVNLIRPGVLVVGNDRWWVGQAFVRVAQQRGIPTIVMQDGLACDKATWSWISADHIAAFSPALRDLLVSHGVSRERIVIAGQPRYDSLCEKRQIRTAASVRAAQVGLLKRSNCGRSVLLATQPHQDAGRVALAMETLLLIDDVTVILRPHPLEPAAKYADHVSAHAGRVMLGTSMNIDTLLDAADVIVTEYSTVALEGAILGIPVIIASFLGDRSDPRIFDGFSIVAPSPAALRDAARTFLSQERRSAELTIDAGRLYSLVGPLDGCSGSRVAHLINSVRESRKVEDDPRFLSASLAR